MDSSSGRLALRGVVPDKFAVRNVVELVQSVPRLRELDNELLVMRSQF